MKIDWWCWFSDGPRKLSFKSVLKNSKISVCVMATAKKVFKLPRGHQRTYFFYMPYSTIDTRNLFHFFIISLYSFFKKLKEWSALVMAALHCCKTKCGVWVSTEKSFDCVDSGSDPKLRAFEFDHYSSQALRLLTLWRDSDRSKDEKKNHCR